MTTVRFSMSGHWLNVIVPHINYIQNTGILTDRVYNAVYFEVTCKLSYSGC